MTHLRQLLRGRVTQKTCSAWGGLLIALIAAARVASTYVVFSETNDEPTHISAGIQLLQGHRYDMLAADPPLPGLFFAAGPWMLGARLPLRAASKVPDAARMLYTAGNYPATLIAARAGNLVFLLIAVAG